LKALVCFYDPIDTRLQWLLKPGFRHVFCVMDDGEYRIVYDALDGRPHTKAYPHALADLAKHYRSEGYTVVETRMGDRPLTAPLAIANCVGLVKAMCAIKAPFVYSPYQLYKYLTRSP
jgi:hypothetical protein